MQKRSFLVFSGSNDRSVFALARAMEACAANYVVIARNRDDRILQSSHRRRVCAIRDEDELTPATFEALLSLVRKRVPDDILVIVPSSEYLNTFLLGLDRNDLHSRLGCELPLVERELYLGFSNKLSSTRLFSAAGIRVPECFDSFDEAHLPLVAKPTCNIGSDGIVRYPILLHTSADLEAFVKRPDTGDYFAQEFICGRSEYLLTYLARSGDVFVTSQSNLAQQPHGKSIVLAKTSTFRYDPITHHVLGLLREQRFHGFAMVEFIVDARGPCFIELNPRPWGPLQLCIDHACGIVEAFIGETLDGDSRRHERIWKDKPSQARYLWLGGMAETFSRNEVLQWRTSSVWIRLAQVARSFCSDVYLRGDSWKVFARELLRT